MSRFTSEIQKIVLRYIAFKFHRNNYQGEKISSLDLGKLKLIDKQSVIFRYKCIMLNDNNDKCLIAWLILNQLALSKTRIASLDNKTVFFSISLKWISTLIELNYIKIRNVENNEVAKRNVIVTYIINNISTLCVFIFIFLIILYTYLVYLCNL